MHPYGHGRMEYICGFMISNLILVTAVTVGKDAVGRLIHPDAVHVSKAVIITLAAAVAIKLIMAWYVKRKNRVLNSAALRAVSADDLSDALVTGVTLIGILLVPYTSLPVDGILGLVVALSILWSGITSFSENLVLLLGVGMSLETEQRIRRILGEYPLVKSVDLITLHDYGPEEKVAFIKVTFQGPPHSQEAVRTLAAVKQRLKEEVKLEATLYWDLAEEGAAKERYAQERMTIQIR